ncbi:hypothetical protein ACMHYB_20735 [Sorangium sp. So ce1128]
MGSKLDKLLPLVSDAAPGVVAGVTLLVDTLRDGAEEQQRRAAELERREAELRRREAALRSREAELERVRRQMAEEASRTAARAAPATRRRFERRAAGVAPPPCPYPIWTTDDDGPKLIVPERITYHWCVLFSLAPSQVRAQVSRQRRSQYRRVARLPVQMGEQLDAAGVPFYALRFVAYGEGQIEQERRCLLMLHGERPPRELQPHERHSRTPAMGPEFKRLRRNRRRRLRRRARLDALAAATRGGGEFSAQPDSEAAAEVEADVGEIEIES